MFINSMATILSYEKPPIINNQFFEFFSLHNTKVAIMLLNYKFDKEDLVFRPQEPTD